MRTIRWGAAVLLAFAAVAMPSSVRAQSAPDAPTFTGFNLIGDSIGVSFRGGSPSSDGYPQATGDSPTSLVKLGTGPAGYALSSVGWPGALGGNAGSLALLLAPDLPPESTALNYPVRAEAFSSGPNEKRQDPGMFARAKGFLAESISNAPNTDGGAAFSTGNVTTTAIATVENGATVVEATTTASDVVIGGTITIESVITVARVVNDGVKATAEGSTEANGVEVAGQPATIDENGIHVVGNDNDNPAQGIVNQLQDQVLAESPFEVHLSRPRSKVSDEGDGVVATYVSGALVIFGGDPREPGEGDGTITVGGSQASSQAVPGLPFTLPELDVPLPTPDGAPSVAAPVDPGAAAPANVEFPVPPGDALSTPVEDIPQELAVSPTPFASTPLSFFSGVTVGSFLLVLVMAALTSRALLRMRERILATSAATACPLEGDHP